MAAQSKEYRFLGIKLYVWVAIALVAGVALGLVLHNLSASDPERVKNIADELKLIGDMFIRLIKMLIIPLILGALISGITSMEESHNFGRVGIKSLIIYLSTATASVALGLVIGSVIEPGIGLDVSKISSNVSTAKMPSPSAHAAAPDGLKEFLMAVVPSNIFEAMADGQILQVVVFAIFFGITMNMVGSKVRAARQVIYELTQVAFKMIEMVVHLAPLAVFGYMSSVIAINGLEVLVSLGWLVVSVLLACFILYMFYALMIITFARLNPIPFFYKLRTTQLMAFSTSSSKATLTTAMRELNEKLGVSEKSTNFIMPLGASINMDGTAIYLGIVAMFFAQYYGVHLEAHNYATLILTCTLGSIGAAGIPSGSIIFMGMVLTSVGIPIEGIPLILGVDRILDMFRTTTNITGDAMVTLVIDKSENQLDEKLYYTKLEEIEN
jgi:Na+/H+-dicarboxylate symporter